MAPSVGEALQRARTQRGIELNEVERVTKIRLKSLRAMEEDRWDELPDPDSARTSLTTYAEYLGLDPEPLVEELRSGVGRGEPQERVPFGVVRRGDIQRGRSLRPLALVLGGLIVAVLLGVVIVAAIGGSGNGGASHSAAKQQQGAATSTGGATAATPASEVSVELRPTADVWVCLIDDTGRPAVNGEILAPGDVRGPFSAAAFDATFGNGSIEMMVNGQPASVPALAQPLGFRITPGKVRRLDPASQPSCS